MVKTLLVSASPIDSDASLTQHGSLTQDYTSPFFETAGVGETARSSKCRAPGTLSDLTVQVDTNNRTTATPITIRKNSADTSLAVSISATTTGTFADTTDTVSLAAGDTFNFSRAHGTDSNTLLIRFIEAILDTTGDAAIFCGSNGKQNVNASSGTLYNSPAGSSFDRSSESDVNIPAPVAGTLSNLQVAVESNARTNTTTWTSRVNGADGNQSVSVTSGSTGHFEDTSNTDSVTAGQNMAMKIATGSGTQILQFHLNGMLFTADDTTGVPFMAKGFYGSSTNEYSFVSTEADDVGTESNVQLEALFDFTWSDLSVQVPSNSSTATTTCRSRINGANGNQVVTYTSGQTGVKQDTSNTDSVTDGDDISFQASGMNATFNIRGISSFAAVAGAGTDVPLDAGSFSLTGQDNSIDIDISAGTNSFLLTGQNLTIGVARTYQLDAGSFTWTGQDLIVDINLAFALGTFALTGYDTTINVGEDVTLDAGSYSWTGLDFTLDLTIPADAGSFTLTGHDLTLSAAYNIALETDSFALTGYDMTLQTSVPIAADAGSFSLTGYDFALDLSSQFAAGSFTMTGYDATINLMIGELVEADAGSFAWSGLDSTLNVDLLTSLEAGQFTMTGLDIAVPFAGVQRISDTDILQKPVNVVLHGTQPVKDRYREFELRQPNIRITPVVTRGGVRNLGNTRPESFTVKKGGK